MIEDALGSGNFSGLDGSQSTLSISWILERSLLARRVDSKLAEKNVVQVEQQVKQYDVAAATAHAFISALALEEKLTIAEQAKRSARQALHDVRKRSESGKSPAADLLRAEVELERRKLDIDDVKHELEVSKRELAAQWGATSAGFTSLSGSLALDGEVMSFAELEQGFIDSPKVKYFLTQERVKQSEIALAQEQAKNRLRFNTGVRRLDQTDDYALVLGVSMPFGGKQRNRARIDALTQEQAGAAAQASAAQIKLNAEVFGLYEGYQHNVHLSEALADEIIPRLEKALVATRNAYDLGRYSYREWSAVQQDVFAAYLELTATRLAAHSNRVELERLTGQSIFKNQHSSIGQP